MSQNAWIFAALFLAFIIFITMRGELGQYLKVIGLG